MNEYRKAVAAAVAIALIILQHFYGVELPGINGPIVDLTMSIIMGAIGVWSVWRVPNKAPAA